MKLQEEEGARRRKKQVLGGCLIVTVVVAGILAGVLSSFTGHRGRRGCSGCVFPFVYSDMEMESCTMLGGGGPWCATKTDKAGNIISWDHCLDLTCPGAPGSFPPIHVHPQNQVGKCCESLS